MTQPRVSALLPSQKREAAVDLAQEIFTNQNQTAYMSTVDCEDSIQAIDDFMNTVVATVPQKDQNSTVIQALEANLNQKFMDFGSHEDFMTALASWANQERKP